MRRPVLWIALVLLALPSAGCFRTIDSGRAGVVWKLFGGTQEKVLGEGVHLFAPWNRLTRYDVRTQDQKELLHILTNNGLSVTIEASIRYRAVRDELPRLHAEIGAAYYDVIIAPVVRSESRKVGGRYVAEEIYSTRREVVEREAVHVDWREGDLLIIDNHLALHGRRPFRGRREVIAAWSEARA